MVTRSVVGTDRARVDTKTDRAMRVGKQRMRVVHSRTHGRAGTQQPCRSQESSTFGDDDVAPEKKQSDGVKLEGRRSWMSIITDVTQLALDLIRVAREGTDLYRKIRFEK